MERHLLNKKLSDKCHIRIRFSDVDAMGIVWHGNYIKYLEDGRESFGRAHGMTYLQIYENGYLTPIVSSQMYHKSPVRYGDEIEITTDLIGCLAAKIVHHYSILNLTTGLLAVEAKTLQVFTNGEGTLEMYYPDFYSRWKNEAKWEDF